MRALSNRSLWTVASWLPLLACSSQPDISIDPASAADPRGSDRSEQPATRTAALAAAIFTGGGTSGAAQPLSPALAPESSTECDPTPSPGAAPGASVQTVCFYGEDDSDAPAAAEAVLPGWAASVETDLAGLP